MKYNRNQVIKSYDAGAKDYADNYYHELDNKPLDRKILTSFAQLIPPNEIIYDMGCGPGQIANFLYQQNINIHGADISRQMIKTAKKLNPNIPFHQDDMLNLKLKTESIFGITAFYAVVHFTIDEVKQALFEFLRVIKKGGYILFSFHVGDEIISIDNFFDHKGTHLDFNFFQINEIKKTLKKLPCNIIKITVRKPYKNVEYASKRAYILVRKQ